MKQTKSGDNELMGVHDCLRVGAVALVMQIGEVNEPMRRRGIANPQPANFQPLRLKPFGVGHDGQRRGQ